MTESGRSGAKARRAMICGLCKGERTILKPKLAKLSPSDVLLDTSGEPVEVETYRAECPACGGAGWHYQKVRQ